MAESIDGMDDLTKRLDAISDTQRMLGRVGLRAVAYAKETVPRKTGNLGRTIRLGAVTDNQVEVIAGGTGQVGYAQAVEFGTEPHEIRPRRKKALMFAARGKTGPGGNVRLTGSVNAATRRSGQGVVFTKKVQHPGTAPQPYLMPAAKRAAEEMGIDVIAAWNGGDE